VHDLLIALVSAVLGGFVARFPFGRAWQWWRCKRGHHEFKFEPAIAYGRAGARPIPGLGVTRCVHCRTTGNVG